MVADPFPDAATLNPGDLVQIVFGSSRGIFRMETELLYRFTRPIPVLIVKAPTEFRRIQRRRFFRLEVHLPVHFGRETLNSDPDGPELTEQGVTENLSAGGLLLVSRKAITEGQLLVIRIELPDGSLQTEAVARRVLSEGEEHYRVGLEFIDLPENDRDRIVSYLFAEQRQRRQLGLS